MTDQIASGMRLVLPKGQGETQGRKQGTTNLPSFADALEVDKRLPDSTLVKQALDPEAASGQQWRLAGLLEKVTLPGKKAGMEGGEQAPALPDQDAGQAPTPEEQVLEQAAAENVPAQANEAEPERNVEGKKDQAETGENVLPNLPEDKQPAVGRNSVDAAAEDIARPEQLSRQGGPEKIASAATQLATTSQTTPTGNDTASQPEKPNLRTSPPPQSENGAAQDKNSGGQNRDSGGQQQALRVVSSQSAPSPAAPLLSSASGTSTALVHSLAADSGFSTAASEAARAIAAGQTRGPETVHTLKIQLYPAELGTVTAKLTVSGEQLSVELSVETTEARQKLNADSEAMTRTLRALGYEVDRVTIQQAPVNSNNASGNGQAGRSADEFSANGGDNRQGRGDSDRTGDGDGAGRDQKRQDEERNARARDSLYI